MRRPRRRGAREFLAAGLIVAAACGATALDVVPQSRAATLVPSDGTSSTIPTSARHTLTAAGSPRSATIPQDPVPGDAPPTSAALVPVRLRIAAIGVDVELTGIGRDDTGVLVPPEGIAQAGWFTGSTVPGETGPAIIAGHVDDTRQAGVFARLRDLVTGDTIEVVRSDGTTREFRVTGSLDVAKAAFPTEAVYGATPDAQLRLITCNGPYDYGVHHYANNLVVEAVTVG